MTKDTAWQVTGFELARLGAINITYIRTVDIDNKAQFILLAEDGR